MNLTTATPAEIDTALADIYGRAWAVEDEIRKLDRWIEEHNTAVAKVEADPRQAMRYYAYTPARLADLNAKMDLMQDLLGALLAETQPYDEEFDRRGGWTRAWLVDNNGGHVHNSMSCSTCYPTTRFGWLPQVSGLDEAEIVEQAGDGACTICYPSAPAAVKNNPNPIRLELPARKEAREAREVEKAARLAKKIEKAVTADGSELVLTMLGSPYREHVKTLVTGRSLLTDHVESVLIGLPYRLLTDESYTTLVEAIAAKEGKAPEQVIAEATKRAEKRK